MSKINKKSMVFGLGILAILAFGFIFMPFNNTAMAAYSVGTVYQINGGGYDNGTPAEVNNPKPTIDSINPKSSNVGVGTKTITISGSGFVPGSIVKINGSNRSATFIDDGHLLVQITGNDISLYRTNGGFFISVWNGAPGGGYSNAVFFTINNPVASPVTNTNSNSSTTNFSDTNNTASNTNNANNVNNTTTSYTDTTQPGNTNIDNASASGNYNGLASAAVFGSNSFLPSGLIQWILLAIIILIIVILARKIFGAKENYDEAPMKHA